MVIFLIGLMLLIILFEVILIDMQCKIDALMEFFDLEKKKITSIFKK